MDIELFITFLFCMIDEQTGDLLQHPDSKLHPSEIVTLALLKRMKQHAFRRDPENLKICQRGEQNERMVVESVFSLCTRLLGLNNIVAKSFEGFQLAVASIFALFNTLLDMNRRLGLYSQRPSIAHFCCL